MVVNACAQFATPIMGPPPRLPRLFKHESEEDAESNRVERSTAPGTHRVDGRSIRSLRRLYYRERSRTNAESTHHICVITRGPGVQSSDQEHAICAVSLSTFEFCRKRSSLSQVHMTQQSGIRQVTQYIHYKVLFFSLSFRIVMYVMSHRNLKIFWTAECTMAGAHNFSTY
jgi:hypothetical protein